MLQRDTGRREHRYFSDVLDYLVPGDVLVLNDSRVIPARLRGVNARTGGGFEILLLEENAPNDWWTMMKPGKRAHVGTRIEIRNPKSETPDQSATVIETNAEGHRRLRFEGTSNIVYALDALGEVPLPPYITRNGVGSTSSDSQRYQTVFANTPGSIAAPTAGLHFTEALLDKIRGLDVRVCFVTLHVGLGTFAPVKSGTLEGHVMHEERFTVSESTSRAVNEAKAAGRRVIAVGTTTLRVLESLAQMSPTTASGPTNFPIASGDGRTRIFIHPPHQFKVVDALITNFHLPCSTLLMLVSAFAAPGETRGQELILAAYAEAIREQYRFFSYGDAMLIL